MKPLAPMWVQGPVINAKFHYCSQFFLLKPAPAFTESSSIGAGVVPDLLLCSPSPGECSPERSLGYVLSEPYSGPGAPVEISGSQNLKPSPRVQNKLSSQPLKLTLKGKPAWSRSCLSQPGALPAAPRPSILLFLPDLFPGADGQLGLYMDNLLVGIPWTSGS